MPWDLFGVGGDIDKANAAATQLLKEAGPIVDEIEERLNGILANNLNRLDGATIKLEATFTINLKPYPKADAVTSA